MEYIDIASMCGMGTRCECKSLFGKCVRGIFEDAVQMSNILDGEGIILAVSE